MRPPGASATVSGENETFELYEVRRDLRRIGTSSVKHRCHRTMPNQIARGQQSQT
jgi:hypothetical protein